MNNSKSMRAARLIVGDIVSHDPAYGTRAVITYRAPTAERGYITLGFRNVYEGCVYTRTIYAAQMFDVEGE